MASGTTIYDVVVRYATDDKASPTLAGIAREADHAAASTGTLESALRRAGAAIAAFVGIGAAKKAFIDFNADVEMGRMNMAAIENMFTPGQSFDQSMKNAESAYGRYQKAAIQSTATTKEFLDMHLSLAPTFAKFHVEGKKIEEIVQGATVAAPILGERPETFAMDVKQMLQGSVTLRDRSAISLLSMMGVEREEFNRNTKKDVNYAIKLVNEALTSPAIMEARKRMEGTFKGVTSTLEDTFQILGGQAGESVFHAVTDQVKSWNMWLTKNDAIVKQFVKDVGDGLLRGFREVQAVGVWVVNNASTLKLIGEVFLATQGLSMLGGSLAGNLNSFGTGLGNWNNMMVAGTNNFGAMLTQVAGVTTALSLLYLGLDLLADKLDREHKKIVGEAGDTAAFKSTVMDRRDFGAFVKYANEFGAIDKDTLAFDRKAFEKGALLKKHMFLPGDATMMGAEGEKWYNEALNNLPGGRDIIERHIGRERRRLFEGLNTSGGAPKQVKNKKEPGVNITINRIEVASDDPDRFVMGVVSAAERARSTPTQARGAFGRAF